MCGRFTVTTGAAEIEARFGLQLPTAEGTGRFNVAPTEQIAAVTARKEGGRKARMLRWGLVPHWADDLKVGARMINARSETALSKSPFKDLIGHARSRCLIVADGFYEWLRPEDPKQPRQPFRFTIDDGALFAFAGLWTKSRIDGDLVESATILTCAPNDVVARLHDRMPVILASPEDEEAWLGDDLDGPGAVQLCRPVDAERMRAAPVSIKVNKAGVGGFDSEGPHLLQPEPEEIERASSTSSRTPKPDPPLFE